ncbi:hypothetical protein [Amycolatopsis sp. DSM 110486]|uniref:hypothetical protein n=1 Tax=Amycolatopsis sp. DSM 110486 TaxID=2865832 RepID=UPI001C69EE68|nr:hypothetical protein [Amycolatopsis sp. DSM 110486]QYN18886.1 hypothetical protein K1T34_40270 [Amycolatopsis sp. DSM 110486]
MSKFHSIRTAYGEYQEFYDRMNKFFDLSARLPDQVFRGPKGESLFGPYDDLIDPEFWTVISALARWHGDARVYLLSVRPGPDESYLRDSNFCPAVSISVEASEEDYWAAIGFDSIGDSAPSIALTTNVMALTGDSGKWGFWAERDPEVAVYRGDFSVVRQNNNWMEKFGPFRD